MEQVSCHAHVAQEVAQHMNKAKVTSEQTDDSGRQGEPARRVAAARFSKQEEHRHHGPIQDHEEVTARACASQKL